MKLQALLLGGLVLLAHTAAAAPETIIELEDPPGDADGPGSFLAPTDSEISVEDFDLLKFAVRVDGNDAIFEVTVGNAVRSPSINQRTNATLLDFTNGIYLQNIDIYLDTEQAAGSGHSLCIPGRRVAFADGKTWERAIVLTPQPASARAVVEAVFGGTANDVIFPGPLHVLGRKIIARVPISRLGGRPRKDWGYSVQLSGAAWERNFNLLDVVKGAAAPDALTMPVMTTGERWAFGGSDGTKTQPQVIDVIVPANRDQHQVLSTSDEATNALAQVPFVYVVKPAQPAPGPEEAAAPPPPSAAEYAKAHPPAPKPPEGCVVSDVADEIITITGAPPGLSAMSIGQVLDEKGAVLAKVVVVQAEKSGVVASVLDHKERIVKGAKVRFPGHELSPAVDAGKP